jgi:hypothetical protein
LELGYVAFCSWYGLMYLKYMSYDDLGKLGCGMEKRWKHLVNLSIIFEKMVERGFSVRMNWGENSGVNLQGLKGMKFYEDGQDVDPEFLLICQRERVSELPAAGCLLLLGDWSCLVGADGVKRDDFCSENEVGGSVFDEMKGSLAEFIWVAEDLDFYVVWNFLTDLFVRYREWEKELDDILQGECDLNDICQSGLSHFQKVLFVHDEYYYILACPEYEPGRTKFDYNSNIGHYMQDSETLAHFQTSAAYQETLKTVGGQCWDSDFNDEVCLYANIWIEDSYKGRVIILETNPSPGKLREVTFFGDVIKQAILNRYVYPGEDTNSMQSMLMNAINNVELKAEVLEEKAAEVNWKMDDQYICGKIAFGKEKISHYMIFGICNTIRQQIKGSCTCYLEGAIYVLINLTIGKMTEQELRMQMSYIIREVLLHVGVSNVFENLLDLPMHMQQAEIALSYPMEKNLTSWYNEFSEEVLDYWLTKGKGTLPWKGIMADGLLRIKEYDRKNGTDLYQTLKVYLMCERNSTLTAQTLAIHRSTLPHRIERINKVTGVNLDDYLSRLYLMMSFAVEDLGLE